MHSVYNWRTRSRTITTIPTNNEEEGEDEEKEQHQQPPLKMTIIKDKISVKQEMGLTVITFPGDSPSFPSLVR